MIRNYVNGAPLVTLATAVNTTDVGLAVASTAGYPPVPFTLAFERGTANEEVVLCTDKIANAFTVTRGWNGTIGKNHSIGAAIEHTTAAVDYVDANTHFNDPDGDVHAQYILKSAINAKGRILIGTGVGSFTPLVVGANDTVLVADSTQASGVKWATIVGASITDGSLAVTKLDAGAQQSMIARQAGAPGAVNGREYYDTGASRPFVYVGAWYKKAFGVGYISYGTGAPGGGSDGDLYLRYT